MLGRILVPALPAQAAVQPVPLQLIFQQELLPEHLPAPPPIVVGRDQRELIPFPLAAAPGRHHSHQQLLLFLAAAHQPAPELIVINITG